VRHLTHRAPHRSGFLFGLCFSALLAVVSLPVLITPSVYAADSPLYPDVRLVATEDAGLEFVFSPRNWQVDTGFSDGVRVSFDQAQWSTHPGAPSIPQRSVLIAVPAEGDVIVEAQPASWHQASSRQPVLRGSRAAAERFESAVAPPLVRWEGPFASRDLRLIRVWLAPVQSIRGRLMRTDALTVSVRWTGTPSATPRRSEPVFDPIYENTLLNWQQARILASPATRLPLFDPWAGSSQWFKITVRADAPHRITFSDLQAAGFPVATSDPRDYRLFYAGGSTLPVRNSDPRPVFKEVPIEITGEGDGSFDGSDVLYFFGQSANRFQNNDSDAVYVINPYTRDVVFWLTPSGSFAGTPLRVSARAAAPGADLANTRGVGRVVSEQDNELNLERDNYFTWYWQESSALSTVVNLPGATTGSGHLAITSIPSLGPTNSMVQVNGTPATFIAGSGFRSRFDAASWLPNTSIELGYVFSGDAWFDRIEAVYPLSLDASVVREFWISAGTGNHVQVNNVPAGALVWDITAADSPVVVQGTLAGAQWSFDPDAAARERRFRIWTRPEAVAPFRMEAEDPGSLRNSPPAADMIIVAHPAVRAPLDDYAAWRSARSGITVTVVEVDDIYRDFGFGQFDPVAIRDFLKYAYETATPRPSACLLVGDGSYDFLDHLSTGTPNQIPPFLVHPQLDKTAGDQNFVSFGRLGTLDQDTSRVIQSDRGWDMMIARWPVRNAGEAQVIANKIRSYEGQPEFGTWRNRVLLVADDEFGDPPSDNEWFHTDQMNGIEDHVPDTYDRSKIMLVEYDKDASGKKPGVQQAILKAWNDGVLLIDYVGHGSPNVWAHEDVFRRTRDMPQLSNGAKLPLVYTASCSIGFFDDPRTQGMGEELVRKSDGGAIAIISATRLVFSQPNVDLNMTVFDFLLGSASMTVGQSLFSALIARQYSIPNGPVPLENDRKHVLMGDPFMHLARPEHIVSFDTAVVPDSLVALRPVQVKGEVQDSAASPVNVGGNYVLTVRDAPRQRQYQFRTLQIDYELEGRLIFEGAFPVDSAGFDFSVMVPKDVSYGEDGGRIVMYAEGTASDALGVLAPLPISTTADSTTDTEGPLWNLTINDSPPTGTVRVGPEDIWRAQISDPLGINIGGGGHGISVTVDNDEFTRRDITELFKYDVGSFSTGSIDFSLPGLAPGPHDVRLTAWDNANNPGIVNVAVESSGDVEYEIRDLLVYPNPFDPDAETAHLTYELTFPPDRVLLSVFTVAGNRIRTFDDTQADIGFNFATRWDGTDDVGDRVAAGVYILAVEAEAAGRKVKDFTKIVLIRSD
jgi:hypothetical protein